MTKLVELEYVSAQITSNSTVASIGGGGGLLEADALLEAIEKRYVSTGQPRNLKVIHSLGMGNRIDKGINRLAHEGLVRSVIGGHWVWSPRMQALARTGKIEAYALPAGVMMQLIREIGAGRPGLITHIGLGTFVDPLQSGGKMNHCAKEVLVERIQLAGKDYLYYKAFPIDFAILRGSVADCDGNISLVHEGANLESFALAVAAHNSGGKVFVQVKSIVESGSLSAREVTIPSALVDGIILVPEQQQSYKFDYDPRISGEKIKPDNTQDHPVPLHLKGIISRRAALEIEADSIVNFGFGLPDLVAKQALNSSKTRFYQTIEHGLYGGELLGAELFGFVRNPTCIIDAPSQFDLYSGGGLDCAFLSFGEFDSYGNVNVSSLRGIPVGPGGFIDISQSAKKVVFCGLFEAKGIEYNLTEGSLSISKYGEIRKLKQSVEQITFSGKQGWSRGQKVLYVTERAVFELTKDGVELIEIAPGVDLAKDILARMSFVPKFSSPVKLMPKSCFE